MFYIKVFRPQELKVPSAILRNVLCDNTGYEHKSVLFGSSCDVMVILNW